ncbi:MAG TPA: DNA alkylation repair protein, partial [Anaerolineales bacterium]|nr:DNA alkylation repair protein [Anaerolineales bacterium]
MYPSAKSILEHLRSLANPENVAGMARFGINPEKTYGISIPELRRIARQVGKDHELAQDLWDSGIHEARILACFIDEPAKVTEAQMDRWAADFDSWDVCDQCCGNLFDRTPFAYQKALEWSEYEQEFVKRAAFALMAYLAVHDKKAPDSPFEAFLPIIVRESSDDRNYVKKAVNWALRQVGKRSRYLNERAIEIAE